MLDIPRFTEFSFAADALWICFLRFIYPIIYIFFNLVSFSIEPFWVHMQYHQKTCRTCGTVLRAVYNGNFFSKVILCGVACL